jgi:hypothetical protein
VILEPTPGGSGNSFAFDIGIGASGSEQVLIPSLGITSETNATVSLSFYFPLSVAAGSRLSARVLDSIGNLASYASAVLVGEGFASPSGASRVTAYGMSTSSQTSLAVPGAVNTKGAWTQIVAATTNQMTAANVMIGTYSPANAHLPGLVDIGVGASGSEQVIVGNVPVISPSHTGASTSSFAVSYLLPLTAPAGSRLAMRYQAGNGNGTYSNMQVYASIYGIE